MKAINCKHIRLKDAECGTDVEKLIQYVENKYKIDFKTLPQWKELIKKLNYVSTYCDCKINEVNIRRLNIINKLYVENFRQSPFELTDKLIRTADVWLKSQWMKQQKNINKYDFENKDGPAPSVQSSIQSEIESLLRMEEEAVTEDFEKNIAKEDNNNIRNAAVNISSNQHKLLSMLDLQYSDLSYHSIQVTDLNEKSGTSSASCKNLDFQLIRCYPKEIVITSSSFKEQVIEFSLQNMSTYCCSVIFKNFTNRRLFQKAKVFPYLTVKLYPGLSFMFKFVFKLIQTKVDFSTNLFFRVQYKESKTTNLTEICIPVTTQFVKPFNIEVSKVVVIPPVYEWHLDYKSMYPLGILKIESKEEKELCVKISKMENNLSEGTSFRSIDTITLNTESVIYRNEESENFNGVNTWSSKFSDNAEEETDENFILSLIKDVIEIALNSFIFDKTWLRLPPNSIKRVRVHFNKSEHIGFHQSYYNIEFRDINTYDLIDTKTFKVYAETLPHPLIFYPNILDMSNSPILHGVCMDSFLITNTHKIYAVTIKIETSRDTRKLISIKPMKDIILPQSSLKFHVKTCSSGFTSEMKSEEMVHFTIKIIPTGDKSIYENIPPIYYEIIAPCVHEFNKISNGF